MAIVIPSKNIYGNPINAKIRDNVIDNVKVEITKVAPDNQYEISVFNQRYYTTPTAGKAIEKKVTELSTIGSSGTITSFNQAVVYTKIIPYYASFEISFPILRENNYISKVYEKTNKEGYEYTQYSLRGNRKKQEITSSASGKILTHESTQDYDINIGKISYNAIEEETKEIEIINLVTEIENSVTIGGIANQKVVNGNVIIDNTGNIKDATGSISNDVYSISLTVLAGEEVWTLQTQPFTNSSSNTEYDEPMQGYYENYQAQEVEITVYGNTIGISLTDGTVTYKNGNHPHSLSGNELLQEGTKTDNKITSEHLATGVLNSYARGKETAKLLCDIGEYKDENGNLKISAKNTQLAMHFNEGDLVIPMTKSANGEDLPMSRYKDGKPKVFEVVKTNFIYDGATWQDLTLQEATQKGE